MPDKSAGEASVKIVPDAKNFIRDLENDLRRRKAEFAVDVRADITRAGADIDRFRTEQERRPVKIRVEADQSGLNKLKSDLEKVGASLGSALKFNLGAAGIGELPALATALATVAGSMQQLAGAGAVLPGVFAGLGADALTAKLAVMGVGDAFKAMDKAADGSAKNVAAANAALAKLAPQTADFVREVYGIKPAFDSFQKDISGKFFDDLGKSVKNLATADLPVLQRGLGGIATAFNQNLKQLGSSLGSDSSKGLLDRILGNTGDAQARLSKTIDPIVHAFGTLAAVGSDTLPRLADGVGNLADRFDHFITAATDTGKLDTWINDGITGFDHLGNTLLNLGKVVTDITGAAGGGGGLLNWLDQGSTKLHDFLSSTQGQDTLRKFFADGREELQQLLPILQNLGPIAQGAFQAAHDATQVWAPVIKEVTDVLARDPQLVTAIADAFLAWKFVGVISGVSDAVTGISGALGLVGPAAAEAGTAAAAGLGPFAAVVAAIGAGILYWQTTLPQFDAARAPGEGLDDYLKRVGVKDTPPVIPPKTDPNDPGLLGDAPPVAPPPDPRKVQGPISGPGGSSPFGPGGPLGGFATGGILPGFSPGVDNLLGMLPGGGAVGLSGGEGIITPDRVREIGPDAIHGLNSGGIGGLLAGLFGGGGSSSSSDKQDPAQWLGSFGAKTLLSFGSTLYQGALDFVGLGNSALSPNNPYFQDAGKLAGGVFGGGSTAAGSSKASKGPTEKQLREGAQKVQRSDQRVAEIKQRIAELKPDAKDSQKLSLQNDLANATQDSQDSRSDLAAIQQGLPGGGPGYNSLDAFAASQAGKPYISGGQSTAGTDCSGWASEIAKKYMGGDPFSPDRMTTQNAAGWITSHGGFIGQGPPGSLQIGWYNHGSNPDDGHMAVTLPDGTNTESGGSGSKINFGGSSAGANSGQFEQHGYFLAPSQGYAKGGIVGYAPGGIVDPKLAAVIQPPKPPPVPDIQKILPKPAGAPSKPAPSSVPRSVAPLPINTPAATPPPPNQQQQQFFQQPEISAQPSDIDHNAPGITTGIKSAASAIGNAASAALSGGGGFGIPGAGQAVSGLIQEGGKAVADAANVVSSFLVGNVTPGTQGLNAYGTTEIPPQQQPATAPTRHQQNYFYGQDANEVAGLIDLQNRQDAQAVLASSRG